jgi:hypothetical protein
MKTIKRILIVLTVILLCRFVIFPKIISAEQDYLPKSSLIKGTGPKVYVLENRVKRWIPSPDVFNNFKYRWENINLISDALLGYYPEGEELGKYDDYPEGSLLKGAGPEIYLVENGKRRWITSPAVMEKYQLEWRNIIQVDDKDLNKIEKGDSAGTTESNRHPDAFILEGPKEGESVQAGEITFKFSGTNPLGKASDLTFETYLKGYDTRWQGQSSATETYKLDQGKTYTFYVRAKNKEGYYDLSPAWRNFRLGVSPYYGKVEIDEVQPEEDNFEQDYLVLRSDDREIINISGWTIKNKNNESFTIPRAAEKFNGSAAGSQKIDIILNDGDEVIVSARANTVQGNFRVNKCSGYLGETNDFNPELDIDCPETSESQYSYLKKTCREYIDDLNQCEIPDYSKNFDVAADSQCTAFLNDNFNYSQCFKKYGQDVDFLTDEWRLFMGKTKDFFDDYEDKITLTDSNGLLVDEYSY